MGHPAAEPDGGSQGLKPASSCGVVRPKAEALGYLEAKVLRGRWEWGVDSGGAVGAVDGASADEVPGGCEEDGQAYRGVEEEADGEGGGEGLAGVGVGGGGPGEDQAAGQGDAAGDGEFGESEEKALLPTGGRDEEGADHDWVESEHGREEGERFGEL
jgi:hypothetical protein